MLEMPTLDLEKCTGCGKCAEACHCKAIIMVEGKPVIIETNLCGWCTVCEAVCPVDALHCGYEIIIEG